jgi:hypothetical protein
MAKFAEDDRIEQMNAQKRRMKQMEHKRAVDILLEERRRKMAIDKVCIHYLFTRIIYICLNIAT